MLSKRLFFHTVGYRPHPGQVQIHGALGLPRARIVVAICGTRFGKTLAAAHEMAYEAVRPREATDVNPNGEFMGWCVGPDHDKADLTFDACATILRTFLKGHVAVNKSAGVIEITNLSGARSRIMRRTAHDAGGKGKLVGYAVDFMVIDEAAKIPHADVWENQLSTRLLDRRGRSLHISSPMGVNGYCAALYRIGQSGRDRGIISMKLPSWLNPYLSRELIEEERQRLPKKVFDQEWGAELLADGGMVFSERDLNEICILGPEAPRPDAEYFAGLDLAMTTDHTVLTIARAPLPNERRPRVVRVERFYKLPNEIQIERLKNLQKMYNNVPINVDASGIGKPIVEQMWNEDMNVRAIVTSASGKSSKIDQVKNAAALVERHGILLLRKEYSPAYFEELTLYQWERTDKGNLTAHGPAGKHDDCVASFLLTTWWIRAVGSLGGGQSYRAGDAAPPPEPKAMQGREMVIKGDAVADNGHEGGVWSSPGGRHAQLWGNKLFGRGRVW